MKYDGYGVGGRGLGGEWHTVGHLVQRADLRTKGGPCMPCIYARAGNDRDMPFGGAFVYVWVAVHAVGRACTGSGVPSV